MQKISKVHNNIDNTHFSEFFNENYMKRKYTLKLSTLENKYCTH